MIFKIFDFCDEFEVEFGKFVCVVILMFQCYGGWNSFFGEIVMLKVFEDNLLVWEVFVVNG